MRVIGNSTVLVDDMPFILAFLSLMNSHILDKSGMKVLLKRSDLSHFITEFYNVIFYHYNVIEESGGFEYIDERLNRDVFLSNLKYLKDVVLSNFTSAT